MILEELRNQSNVELYIVIAGTALLSKYSSKQGQVRQLLEMDGFKNLHEIHFNLEGSNPTTRSKTAGLAIIEFSSLYDQIRPDIVVARGDRFEILSAVFSAALMGVPVAHIEGGDVSGTIDEAVRHAITKLSHVHFATNEPSKNRILNMGENSRYVFNVGSPDVEVVEKVLNDQKVLDFDIQKTGSGATIDLTQEFVMVMYHPVTTELEELRANVRILLSVIHELGLQTLWFWPNFDTGAEEISNELRSFNDRVLEHNIRFMRYLPPQEYLHLLNKTGCLIGNSSAGVKECSALGVPVVNIGSRQNGRLKSKNVIDTVCRERALKRVIMKQLRAQRYPKATLYSKKFTSKVIAQKLATIPLYLQKRYTERKPYVA